MMKIRKFCFIAIFSLCMAGAAFGQSKEEVLEDMPFWENNKKEFNKTHVCNIAGNEDNSLFLINIAVDEGWHNIVYAFSPDAYWEDKSFHTVWDYSAAGGDVRSLVYSPFSDKFYFTASWQNEMDFEQRTPGLWIASPTGKTWDPVMLSHYTLEDGAGYLIVNKVGVWLLEDKANWEIEDGWKSSVLCQIEDDQGRFIFQIPKALKNHKFHSRWTLENPVNERINDENIKYEYQLHFRNTDYTLLIRDKDFNSWWVFNCITEDIEKYDNYDTALEAAQKVDFKQNHKNTISYLETPGHIIFELFAIICFVLCLVFVILLLININRRNKKSATTIKEHNKMIFDIQEKERAKISRDIHDSVVQDIRVLRLETENLVVDEPSKQRQTKIEDLATDCIVKLRNICYNLTPAELASHNEGDSSKLELISIINSLVQQFSTRTHIPCYFKVDEGFEYPVLEKEETQNLFRVIQEALTNIEKHSYATQVSIFIKKAGNTLLIYITDDGIGCNPDELNKKLKSKDHLGLRSMKDRMELIGGSIEFFTAQNDGMEITIKLPLENA